MVTNTNTATPADDFAAFAAKYGYKPEEAKVHFQQSEQDILPKANESDSIDFATREGEKLKAEQQQKLAAMPEPNVANAATELTPVATNTLLQNANNVFDSINPIHVAEVLAGTGAAYGIYRSLRDKMGQTAPEPTPAEPAQPSFDSLTTETKEPVNIRSRLGLAPKAETVELTPEQIRIKRQAAAAAIANKSSTPATPSIQTLPTSETPPVEPVVPEKSPEEPVKPPEQKTKRGNLAEIANNPPEVPGQPEMRTQYAVPKTRGAIAINPATGEKFIGPGGYNWFASQVGHEEAPQRWKEQYGEVNVPHKQVQADYAATRYPPTPETIRANMGGAAGVPEFIPKYIKGAASPSALATTAVVSALPALAAAAYHKYKGNEAAVDASIQEAKDSLKSLATMPYDVSKAASKGDFGPLKDMLMSMNPGSLLFNETSKNDEEILKKMIYKEKVGAGRGIAPPTR